MTIASLIDTESHDERTNHDGIVVVDEISVQPSVDTNAVQDDAALRGDVAVAQTHREPAMAVFYLGIISLIAILVTSGFLAL